MNAVGSEAEGAHRRPEPGARRFWFFCFNARPAPKTRVPGAAGRSHAHDNAPHNYADRAITGDMRSATTVTLANDAHTESRHRFDERDWLALISGFAGGGDGT
jgi:hypothetical protein